MKRVASVLFTREGKADLKRANKMARLLGIVMDHVVENAITASMEGDFMPATVRKFNAKFFRAILLKQFTDFTRSISLLLAEDAIVDYARAAAEGSQQGARQLKTLGLTVQDVVRWQAARDTQNLVAHPKIATAIDRWINEATLRPRPATRPVFGSDVRFGLIWYLKDFPWTMAATTYSVILQQARLATTRLGYLIPWFAAAIPLIAVGMLADFLKNLLFAKTPAALAGVELKDHDTTAWEATLSAVKRAGVLGPWEMFLQFLENYQHMGLPWMGLISPVAGILQDAAIRGTGQVLKDRTPGIAILPHPVRDAFWSNLGL